MRPLLNATEVLSSLVIYFVHLEAVDDSWAFSLRVVKVFDEY